MDKTEVVKKVHALMNDKNNYTARLQAEEVVEKYVEQRQETASAVDTIVMRQHDLIEKYPEMRDLIMDSAMVHAWYKRHIQLDETIEEGFFFLIKELIKLNNNFRSEYTKLVERKGA